MPRKINKTSDLQPDPHNANEGTERGVYMVEHSLEQYGAGRSILADAEGRVIAGNKTLQAASDMGLPIRVVETDGKELVVVQRTDLDLLSEDKRARLLAYADNRASEVGLVWSSAEIALDIANGVNLDDMFREDELEALFLGYNASADGDGSKELEEGDHFTFYTPDAIFPSDNDYDIPTLLPELQADFLELPLSKWGDKGRSRIMRGTYHFYTDDYKFEALWKDPSNLINSQCVAMIEPNCSTNDQMPTAVGLWGIYKKRWLARYAQEYGVKVWVDLNMALKYRELNLIGVPQGWRSFATRGLDMFIEYMDGEYEIACRIAAPEKPRFLVYGGGKAIEAKCKANGWQWLPENMKVWDGREEGDYD